MPERLRPRDMAFLSMESARTPMHVATLDIFDAREGLRLRRGWSR